MKYFIVADVHGHYDEMLTALRNAGFDRDNPNHCFVSLGDLLDRGRQPYECLAYVCNLDYNRCILIRGNHEDLMEEMLERGWPATHDVHNGTALTVCDLTDCDDETFTQGVSRMNELDYWRQYRRNLRNFHETQNGIFVHGWIPCEKATKLNSDMGFYQSYTYDPNWRNSDNDIWNTARWINGMEAWDNGVREPGKTIFCGHYHTAWGRAAIDETCEPYSNNPADYVTWENDGIVALDACAAFTKFVNCYVFEDEPLEGEEI